MSTSIKVYESQKMQYCGEYIHCIHNSVISYCDLGKWKINEMNEYFFYDPEVPMRERSDVDDMKKEIWEHSLMCKNFEGDAHIVKNFTVSAQKDGFAEYIIECIGNKHDRIIHFFVHGGREDIINKWLRTIKIL